MSDTNEMTAPKIAFSSKAFPSDGDVATWNALSPSKKRAWLIATEDEAFNSGTAPQETLDDRLARVRADIS